MFYEMKVDGEVISIPAKDENFDKFIKACKIISPVLQIMQPFHIHALMHAVSLLKPVYVVKLFEDGNSPPKLVFKTFLSTIVIKDYPHVLEDFCDHKLIIKPLLSTMVTKGYPYVLEVFCHHKLIIKKEEFTSAEVLDALETAILFKKEEMIEPLLTYSQIVFKAKDRNASFFYIESAIKHLKNSENIIDMLYRRSKSVVKKKVDLPIPFSFILTDLSNSLDIEKPLETLLEEHQIKLKDGFIIEKVPGDGNCFFHAIARGLKSITKYEMTNLSHKDIRLATIKYIRENKEEFLSFVVGENRQDEALENYLTEMSNYATNTTAWAEGIMLNGVSKLYELELNIQNIHHTGAHTNLTIAPNDNVDFKYPAINLILYLNHYYLLSQKITRFDDKKSTTVESKDSLSFDDFERILPEFQEARYKRIEIKEIYNFVYNNINTEELENLKNDIKNLADYYDLEINLLNMTITQIQGCFENLKLFANQSSNLDSISINEEKHEIIAKKSKTNDDEFQQIIEEFKKAYLNTEKNKKQYERSAVEKISLQLGDFKESTEDNLQEMKEMFISMCGTEDKEDAREQLVKIASWFLKKIFEFSLANFSLLDDVIRIKEAFLAKIKNEQPIKISCNVDKIQKINGYFKNYKEITEKMADYNTQEAKILHL